MPPHLWLERRRILRWNVRRVGDNQVNRRRSAVEQVAIDEGEPVLHTESRRVPPRHRESRGRNVSAVTCESGNSRASAMAMQPLPVPTSITGAQEPNLAREAQRFLDDELGLGTWNQDVGCDLEFEAPEFAPTGDVGDGFSGGAAGDERASASSNLPERVRASGR